MHKSSLSKPFGITRIYLISFSSTLLDKILFKLSSTVTIVSQLFMAVFSVNSKKAFCLRVSLNGLCKTSGHSKDPYNQE